MKCHQYLSVRIECVVFSDSQTYFKLLETYGVILRVLWRSERLTNCFVGFELGRRLLDKTRRKLRLLNAEFSSVDLLGYLRSMTGGLNAYYRQAFVRASGENLFDVPTNKFSMARCHGRPLPLGPLSLAGRPRLAQSI
jgi:hypothetical protein